MKNNNNISELSNEKLIKRRNLLKGFLIGIGIVWIFMIAFLVYIYINQGFSKVSFPTLLPICILPITLMPLIINVGLLNKEIKSRKL